MLVVGGLEQLVAASEVEHPEFASIDDEQMFRVQRVSVVHVRDGYLRSQNERGAELRHE